MILTIDDLLKPGDLDWLRGLYDELDSRPGLDSAGSEIKEIKSNLELALAERADEVRSVLVDALNNTPFLNDALLPRTSSNPILSIYETGMSYGYHTDSAIGADAGRRFRSDISVTIFLDDPDSYVGGELVILTDTGEQSYKPRAGAAVFYPTHYRHRVNEVTGGRRRACVMWFESFVRDAEKRSILFELFQLRGWMQNKEPIASEPRQRLIKVCENLYRMWIET